MQLFSELGRRRMDHDRGVGDRAAASRCRGKVCDGYRHYAGRPVPRRDDPRLGIRYRTSGHPPDTGAQGGTGPRGQAGHAVPRVAARAGDGRSRIRPGADIVSLTQPPIILR